MFFNERWVPYAERVNYLCDADVAISLHHDHVETRFSFRTRFLDCFWTGLPLLATAGDVLADAAAAAGAGVTLADGDVDGVAEALRALALDADRRRTMGQRSHALGEGYTWERVARPLAAFCAQPYRAADGGRRELVMPRMPSPRGSRLRVVLAAYRLDGAGGVVRRIVRRLKRWPARTHLVRR